ncbi:MAG TPA: PEGA domain-containing protein [Chthoniobacterales bacterium]|nr:PEGA domain-containing protein [Chthoniobacterales bacterium]
MSNTDSFQHFRILQRPDGTPWELGRGAMGITYKAFDTNLRYDVALKVINAQLITSDSVKQRFIREARSAAQLSHPNVARVFHLGETDAGFFYAMEYVDGETVERRVQRTGPIRLDLALRIVRQVTRALIAAERQRLVHRDIKPSNIMLVHSEDDEHIQVKVIDFGLAKSLVSSADLSGAITVGGFVGTPHFASPEQLKEQNVDLRSDIYSLGATLWFMITGQPPFRGSIAEVIYDHMAVSPSEEVLRQVPAPVADLLRKMLAKPPGDRFQSPLELSQTLDQLLKEVEPSAGMTTFTVPTLQTASTSESIFSTGQIIANRYEVRQRWPADTSVFAAVDLQNHQPVGLRVFLPKQLPISDPGEAENFYFLRDIRHSNLVAINSVEQYEHALVVVSEWIHGFTLFDLLRVHRELSWPEVLVLARPFASVLDFLTDRQELKGVIKLRKTYVSFAEEPADLESLQHDQLSSWPTYSVKADTLDLCTDVQPAEPTETLVSGSNLVFSDHPIRQLAALLYELLGGVPNPSGSGAGVSRFAPLPKLTENGNTVLRRALLDPDYFPSAVDFFAELERFNRRDFQSAAIKYAVDVPQPKLVAAPMLVSKEAPPVQPDFAPSLKLREATSGKNSAPAPPPQVAPPSAAIPADQPSRPPKRLRGPIALLLWSLAAAGLGFFGFKVFERYSPGLADQAPSTGTFSISSSPAGATVRWQGHEIGKTPLTNYTLAQGDQTIELVMPNYLTRQIEFTVKDGASADLGLVTLTKESGKIKLTTTPSGVAFKIGGPDQKTISGKTPANLEDLPVGKYEITLNQPGWPDYSETVDLAANNPVEINHTFRGTDVTLSSDPPGASIFLGQTKLGETPLTVNLPSSPVEITSRFGQLAPVTQNINPDPQWVTAVQFKHSYGTLVISSDRPDAHAFVDGKEIGHLPAEALLPPGNHKVLLAAANLPDKVSTVALAEGQHFDLHFPLTSTNGVSSSSASPTPAPTVSATPAPSLTPRTMPTATAVVSATPVPKLETPKPAPSPTVTPETTPVHSTMAAGLPTPTSTPSATATPSPTARPTETATPTPEATIQPNSRAETTRTRVSPTPRPRPTPTPKPKSTPPPTRQTYQSQSQSRTAPVTVKASPKPTPDAQREKAKEQAFHFFDAEWAAKQNALKAEKQDLDYQIKNSTGPTQNQWKQKLGQWQKEKTQADRDHSAARASLKKEWGQ